jgi:hypothetical protein
MFSYTVYGLGVHSPLLLPELIAKEREADVTIRFGSVDHLPSVSAGTRQRICVTAEDTCFVVEQIGTFLIQGGREIVVDPAARVEDAELRLCILGPALALLLHQRGQLVLHASAIAAAGGAVALLGDSGWGKSTLAAALYARGHTVVADDVVAVDAAIEVGNGREQRVVPGFPQLKLWPEAAAALGYAPGTLPRLHHRIEKRVLGVASGFACEPLPLSRVYVLAEGQEQVVEPLRSQEALLELVRHSYCARFLHAADAATHFRQCASVAHRVPLRRLRAPRSLAALPDLTRLVEQDLTEGS